MKYTQRLDYGRLAEVLHERGLAELDSIQELLQLSKDDDTPFCEALVNANIVSDWELSKVVCETFQLPFLPVDLVTPNPAALAEVDLDLFRQHQLVPIDLFGQILTVAMPALVPAEVLAQVSAVTDYTLLPMVGTVESNRRWIEEFMAAAEAPEADSMKNEGSWESMFDAADAEVAAARVDGGSDAAPSGSLDPNRTEAAETDSVALEQSLDLGTLDLGSIEALPADDLETEPMELPPMPEFGQDQREAG